MIGQTRDQDEAARQTVSRGSPDALVPAGPVTRPLGNRATGALLRNPAIQRGLAGGRPVQRRNDLSTRQLDQDSVFETLAHEMAYQDEPGMSSDRLSRLHALGYRALALRTGPGGLEYRGFVDNGSDATPRVPVLAFRGTEGEIDDILTDADSRGVGYGQFTASIGRIREYLTLLGGPAVMVGHSLGGALAQMAAATFPTATERVVTFNSPGIPTDMADDLRRYNESAEEDDVVGSTHYQAEGDVVDDAGEAHTDGQVVEVGNDSSPGGTGFVAAHTRFMLWDLQRIRSEQGDAGYGRARVRVSQTQRGYRPVEEIRRRLGLIIEASTDYVQGRIDGVQRSLLPNPVGLVNAIVDTAVLSATLGVHLGQIRQHLPHVPEPERAAIEATFAEIRTTIHDRVKPIILEALQSMPEGMQLGDMAEPMAERAAQLLADRIYQVMMNSLAALLAP